MRISMLRHSNDRVPDRILTFPTMDILLRNPYIRADNDPYPEMDYCYDPDLASILLGPAAQARHLGDHTMSAESHASLHQRKQSRLYMRRFGKSGDQALSASMVRSTQQGTMTAQSQQRLSEGSSGSEEEFEEEQQQQQQRPLFAKRAPKAPAVVVTTTSEQPPSGLPLVAMQPQHGGGVLHAKFTQPLPSNFRTPPPITSAPPSHLIFLFFHHGTPFFIKITI